MPAPVSTKETKFSDLKGERIFVFRHKFELIEIVSALIWWVLFFLANMMGFGILLFGIRVWLQTTDVWPTLLHVRHMGWPSVVRSSRLGRVCQLRLLPKLFWGLKWG